MHTVIKQHLETLAQKDPQSRRNAMEQILQIEGLPYRIQEAEPSYQNAMGIRNFLIETELPALLFCAHYDSVPGSSGANDNAAAVCILVALAKELQKRGIPANFAFFDGEETNNAGSRLYASDLPRDRITAVLNLDVCGYGDTIAICGKGHERKAALKPFCRKDLLAKYNAQIVRHLPKSDDTSFSGRRIPVMSLCTVPRWDIQYLKALAAFGGGLLGLPPEYGMILGQMEVSTTMHGGFRDAPEWVEEEAMERMYQYLLEAIQN